MNENRQILLRDVVNKKILMLRSEQKLVKYRDISKDLQMVFESICSPGQSIHTLL